MQKALFFIYVNVGYLQAKGEKKSIQLEKRD